MSNLTNEEMAIVIASAIGASVADLARVLPRMSIPEREGILSQAKRLNAVQERQIEKVLPADFLPLDTAELTQATSHSSIVTNGGLNHAEKQ